MPQQCRLTLKYQRLSLGHVKNKFAPRFFLVTSVYIEIPTLNPLPKKIFFCPKKCPKTQNMPVTLKNGIIFNFNKRFWL